MRTLPPAARLYLLVVAGLGLVIWISALPQAGALLAPLLVLPILLAWAGLLLAYRAEVVFESAAGGPVRFTADDAIVIFCVSTLGHPGVLVAGTAFAAAQLLGRRPIERVLFNTGMLSITYLLAWIVYSSLQMPGAVPFSGPRGLLAFATLSGVYYGCNALLVSVIIAITTQRPVLQIYRESLFQVSWVHLLTYSIGASMASLYAIDPWLLLYGVITLVVARYAFATVVALNAETRRRQELAEERALLYEEQARLNQELGRASKLAALGTFSAGIAHEFNNVLTAVQGHAQLAQMANSFAEKNYSLDVITRVSQRATSITNSLLTFAREREPDLGLSYLQTAIYETVELVRPDLEYDRITLTEEIADLPPILCDIGQLNQVLLNLITNARDATRGRESASIQIALLQAGDRAVITITDNGPGIPPDVLDRIFQPFVTTKQKGNGLGMAICYGIIEGHKGKIDIASELGKGTVVTIQLPMRTEEPPAVRPEHALMEAA
jgi:signal transduction histidine kinase